MGKAVFDFDKVIERKNTLCRKWDGAEALFSDHDVLPMWIADMDFASPDAVVEAIRRRAAHGVYGYPLYDDSFYEAIRQWLDKRHKWAVETDWILRTPGVMPAISAAVLAFTQPGDKVIIQPPVYPPFFTTVVNNGRQLAESPLLCQNGRYSMDFSQLERHMAAGAKMMLLCSPHNPVGRVWQKAELDRLAELCLHYGVLIVADEIHGDLVFSQYVHTPMALVSPAMAEQTITCIAASKTFNIAGLYTAAAVVPNEDLRERLLYKLAAWEVDKVNLFGLAATTAAYEQGEDWLTELLVYLEGNADYLCGYVKENLPLLRVHKPDGTYLAWLDCRGLKLPHVRLKEFFVSCAKVGLSYGAAFGTEGEGFMRLNFGCPRSILFSGLERIHRAIRQFG